MRDDLTEIVFLLDRSGSMGAIHAPTVEAFNTFLVEQQKEPGLALFTLIQFDHERLVTFDRIALSELLPMNLADFEPRGSTALLDALGEAIDRTGERLAAMPEADRPGRVMVAVLTDGHENASTAYTQPMVADRLRHQQEVYGWEILFLGAGIDVEEIADSLQIPQENAILFEASTQGIHSAFSTVNERVMERRRRR